MTELDDVVTTETLRNKIDAKKSGIKKKYDICKDAARRLITAHDKFTLEEEKGSKKLAKYAQLENRYNVAKEEFLSLLSHYDTHVSSTKELYSTYIKLLDARRARKVTSEMNRFTKNQNLMREKLLAPLEIFIPLESLYTQSVKAEEKKESPVYRQPERAEARTAAQSQPYQPQYSPYYPQSVNIAPMSIDISSIVEDAVAAAMNKFKETFEKRADEYIGAAPQPTGTVAVVSEEASGEVTPDGAEKVLEIEGKLLEDERTIIEKLTDLAENINKLTAEVTELGAAYIDLAGKHKDAVEAQKNINDMQRTIAREIQGVQANQKVINQEQAELSGEQAVIIEHQKANIENQKLVSAAQSELSEMQKTVVDTQSTLEESMKAVLASQKEIISTQQSIVSENLKTSEASRELSAKQIDVTALQKEVIAHQREVARSQKSINAKIEAKKEKTEK